MSVSTTFDSNENSLPSQRIWTTTVDDVRRRKPLLDRILQQRVSWSFLQKIVAVVIISKLKRRRIKCIHFCKSTDGMTQFIISSNALLNCFTQPVPTHTHLADRIVGYSFVVIKNVLRYSTPDVYPYVAMRGEWAQLGTPQAVSDYGRADGYQHRGGQAAI